MSHLSNLKHVNRTTAFSSVLHASPDTLLAVLNAQICDDADLPILYYWKEAATSWPSVLIGRVYARMFDMSTIALERRGVSHHALGSHGRAFFA